METTTEVCTMITKNHRTVADDFVNKVSEMINTEFKNIETYGIQAMTYHQYEQLTLVIDSKRKLEIKLITDK